MSQLTCRTARIYWFTGDIHMQLSWKIEFLMCKSVETIRDVTDDQQKWIISFNKINSWNHVGWLCIDGAFSILSEVRFCLQLWWINGRTSFLPLVFFIDMHWRVQLFQNFDNSFETCNRTCKCYQGSGSFYQSALKRWIDWSSVWNNASFLINILELWLFQILMWIGRRVYYAVEARIWSYYTFS